jgi:hypothetical protein
VSGRQRSIEVQRHLGPEQCPPRPGNAARKRGEPRVQPPGCQLCFWPRPATSLPEPT